MPTNKTEAVAANRPEIAAKIKITGNAVVLTSSLKLETIKKMEKYDKDLLCLVQKDGDDELVEVFRICTDASSSISKYGISFAESNKAGFAVATVLLPNGISNKKEYVKENFGNAILMLRDLEDAVRTACADLEADYAKLDKIIVED